MMAWLAVVAMVLPLAAAHPQPTELPEGLSIATVEERLAQVEGRTELSEQQRTDLANIYRDTISRLQEADASVAQAAEFAAARDRAPAETNRIRAELDRASDAPVMIDVPANATLETVEARLEQEEANVAAMQAQLADVEEQLTAISSRPADARQRLVQTRQAGDEARSRLSAPAPADEPPPITEARRWRNQARVVAATATIRRIDAELLSLPARQALLEAQRDRLRRSLGRANERVQLLSSRVGEERRTVTREAVESATSDVSPELLEYESIRRLVGSNRELSETLENFAAELERLTVLDAETAELAREVTDDFRAARARFEVAGLSDVLARFLVEQRRSLPSIGAIKSRSSRRARQLSNAALRQLELEDERRSISDRQAYVAALMVNTPEEFRAEVEPVLLRLTDSRAELLGVAIRTYDRFLRELAQLDFSEQQLVRVVEEYEDFLDQRLLWIRSRSPLSLGILAGLPAEIARDLSPSNWATVLEAIRDRLFSAPFLALALIAAIVLWVRTPSLRRGLVATGKDVGTLSRDRFASTLKATGYTVAIALPWPLLVGAVGWELGRAEDASSYAKAVGQALMVVLPGLFVLRFWRVMCMRGGLGQAHLGSSESGLQRLRRVIRELMLFVLLPTFFGQLAFSYDPQAAGGGVGLIAILIICGAIGYYATRLLGRRHGVLLDLVNHDPGSVFTRWQRLSLIVGVAVPAVLAALALAGYQYTVGQLLEQFLNTAWLLLGVVFARGLVFRWLTLTRRQLALKAALEKREAARAAREAEGSQEHEELGELPPLMPAEEAVDYESLSADSVKLVNLGVLVSSLAVFWVIWADVLPAFRFLDEINLWQRPAPDGQSDVIAYVTLADLGLALVLVALAFVMTKTVPSLLEIILRQRTKVTSGSLNAMSTLIRYGIAFVGALVFVNMLGADWSKLQWLVAALGVGIGFGLQEIVANFISGLIILVERPIRVGDAVTVGETSGIVTKIRIRATTITDWDRFELIVPNKEFITGRLLNWSLSDRTARIRIPIGIAYGSDVKKAQALMIEAAEEDEHIMDDPKPIVFFEGFGDNTLNFGLRCWVDDVDIRMSTTSRILERVNEKFNAGGVIIAFPQRDVHIDVNQPLEVFLRRADELMSASVKPVPSAGQGPKT